jgi:hypothetical protein
MAFQSQNLVMIGLGVQADAPVNALQPPLRDGIHLRWSFLRERGFPWHGYYLFRRRHRPGNRRCMLQLLRELQLAPGALSTRTLNTPWGQFTSDRNIELTDIFPPPHLVEFDLRNRRYVRFVLPPAQPAFEVQVRVGFLRGADGATRACLDFAGLTRNVTNRFTHQGVFFEVLDHDGGPWQGQMIGALRGRTGVSMGFETHIRLPCPAASVSLSLGHSARGAKVEAIDEAGNVVDAAGMSGNFDTLVLGGPGIVALVVHAPQNEAFLFEICYVCIGEDGEESSIEVRALAGSVPVLTKTLSGLPGQVVTETLSLDSITGVEFSGGPAVVIDVCWVPVDQGVLRGWEIVPEFPYPLCLPTAQGDYPCLSKPATQTEAENRAVDRVRYGDPNVWRGTPFDELHDELERLVVGGPPPLGDPMADRSDSVAGVPLNPNGTKDPVMPEQYPLDLVLLGSLHPAMAQMVGLYWVDETADPAAAYDYLIMADHAGVLGGNAPKALSWLASSPDFSTVDGYVVFNQRVGPAAPLDPPGGARVYALPGSTMLSDGGVLLEASNNAGLRWDVGTFLGFLLPGKPVMYHVWRASLGTTEPAEPLPPAPESYDPVSKERPVLVVEPSLPAGVTPAFPDGWPPFRMHAIDRALPEGWYSYRVNGIDIFGRHSPHSAAARWFQWTLSPGDPEPWYYRDPPGGDAQVHPYAVALLDKIGPPPPTAVEAHVLDPQDPMLLRDAAYDSWRASLTPAERESIVGLRLRWQWTFRHAQQAPDAVEFRVYYEPGRLNALQGTILSTSAASGAESVVETDIPNAQPAGQFAGTRLRVGAEGFRVVDSQAGTPLRLRVANIGPGDDVAPPAGRPCSVTIPEGHAQFVDHDVPTNWSERYYVVDFDEHVTETTDADGQPLRIYELFLPATGGSGLPLNPTPAEPIVYAHVGVSTADDKPHTADAAKWNGTAWGDRPGNEGWVGGPITLVRIRRQRPPVPVPPPDAEQVFATPGDYAGNSYYTYRWQPSPHLKVHIFRALDDAVYKADWARRASASPTVTAADEPLFPVELRGADPGLVVRRGEIAAEINQLNAFAHDAAGTEQAMAHYRGLSNDALRVLAGLPWTEPAFTQITLRPLDPDDPALANRPGPDNPPDMAVDPSLRIYVDRLDGRSTSRYFYRSAYVDGAHNRSEQLSLSSPPVYLPNVVPPRTPVVTKVQGGDREITLSWASNREPDLVEYRLYRTTVEANTRDLRLMDLVRTEPVPVGDPAARPTAVSWSDAGVPGLVTFYYRLAAVDDAGNVSTPSNPLAGRAYDYGPPAEPSWIRAEWVKLDANGDELAFSETAPGLVPAIAFLLRTTQANVTALIQKQVDGGWQNATAWIRDPALDAASGEWVFAAYDRRADPSVENVYRAKLISSAGVVLESATTRTVPMP